jgi:hypothetical protein
VKYNFKSFDKEFPDDADQASARLNEPQKKASK